MNAPIKYHRGNQRRVTHNGQTKTLSEWAKKTGISLHTIACRVRQGWSPEEILKKPPTFGPKKGARFGRWTVLERGDDRITPQHTKIPRARCKCDCGTIRDVTWNSLRRGLSTSCRCSMKKSEA